MLSREQAVGITVIQLYDGDVIIWCIIARSSEDIVRNKDLSVQRGESFRFCITFSLDLEREFDFKTLEKENRYFYNLIVNHCAKIHVIDERYSIRRVLEIVAREKIELRSADGKMRVPRKAARLFELSSWGLTRRNKLTDVVLDTAIKTSRFNAVSYTCSFM